jgi:simple sugar transport system substrate-binding protein
MKRFLAPRLISTLALAITVGLSASNALAANIAVIGGKTDDAFWNKIKKGIDDARLIVEANGGKVNYLQLQSYDNLGPDAAQLVRTAMSQGANGIVVPNWVPEAEDEAIKAAVASGAKVIMINAGTIDKATELGAINYIGSDEYLAGKAGGEYFAAKGQKNIICVNTVPGAANLESRCKGAIEGITAKGGTGKQLPLPATSFGDPTAVAEAIKATLVGDKTIDGVITISAGDADSAAIGISQANATDTVKLGTFDFNEANLERIKSGKQLFAIDQQPYLQSLLGVLMLNAYIDFGNKLPTAPVLTGPGIIDSSTIDATLEGVKKGAR